MQLSLDEIESDCRDQVPSICFEVGVGGPVVNKARMVRRHVVNKRRWERETAWREGYDDELSSPPDAKLGYFRLSLSLSLSLSLLARNRGREKGKSEYEMDSATT